ncbi:MAG: FKBP-type peptidyl-prolyl cis-trans isomerase SlyD [Salibacteraceae bacterium]|jgi:FKBP-type peptidyl-prolyl cis-trans isomerase SlyD
MKIAQNTVVTMHYKLSDKDGLVIDSSEGRDPLAYIQGIGALVPGLETELAGKSEGEKVQAIVQPEHAYGNRDESLIRVVPKSGFQGEEEMAVGMQVQIDTGEEGTAIATLTKIEGDDVTLDLNHPLSDIELHFDVDIIELREATEDELAHGHVHGPDGHEH